MTFQIDTSKYQGTINWPQVKGAGCVGAVVKTSQGTTGVDPNWQANHAGARAVGIPVAPYHFSNDGDPNAEAAHFASFWSAGWDYRWWLDEELATASPAFILAFRARMRALTGYPLAGVYASESLLAGKLNPNSWRDPQTGIWAARYSSTLGWNDEDLLIWQFSSSATVPGILGHVDESEFMNGWTPALDQGALVTNPLVLTQADQEALIVRTEALLSNTDIGAGNPQGVAAETNQLAAAITALSAKVDSLATNVQSSLVGLAAQVTAIQTAQAGVVDVAQLAQALVPLLVSQLSAADLAAFKAQFEK